MRFGHIISAVRAMPWAIDPTSAAWAAILDVLSLRAAGEVLTDAEIAARIDAAKNGPRRGRDRAGAVAVIPVYGVISPRATLLSSMSGGTTAEALSADFAAAIADPDVDSIVFDIDSPGGGVEGIHELAEQIRAARGTKPIVAQANHLAASAAYWIAAAADEIVVTPSGQVGSIGVISAHEDLSAQMEQKGVKVKLITAGKYKAEGSPLGPLDDEALAERQGKVDAFYRTFTSDVAKSRGVGVAAVRDGYGQGRTLLAQSALDAGMVDRVDTLENTIRRVARGGVTPRGDRAAALAAALSTPSLVAEHEPVGGDDPESDDAGQQDPESTDAPAGTDPGQEDPSSDPEASARVLPARRRQLQLHTAALRVGLTLGPRQ